MSKKETPRVIMPLFYRAANDAMYALNVLIAASGNSEIMKLASDLDLVLKSVVKSVSEDANNSTENKSVN